MKILFLTVGNRNVASSRVRVYSYVPYLRKAGIASVIISYTPPWQCRKILLNEPEGIIEKALSKLYGCLMVSAVLIIAPFFDLLYVQKVYLSKYVFAVLKVLKRRIIFDFDDAVYLHKDITHLLRDSSCVIVSNSSLKAMAQAHNKNVYRVISPVETDSGYSKKRGDTIKLGWLGSPEAAVKYLDSMLAVFKKLLEKFKNLNIMFMGSGNRSRYEPFGIRVIDWSLEGEKEFLHDIDIGIMPLENDEWSRAKAGYKLLLYMSSGAACVASPVGMNNEIIKESVNGYFASTSDEWITKISLLLEDSSLRQKIGEESRRTAENLYSYDVNAAKLIEILKKED